MEVSFKVLKEKELNQIKKYTNWPTAVPGPGEMVTLEDTPYTVEMVNWKISSQISITIVLKEVQV